MMSLTNLSDLADVTGDTSSGLIVHHGYGLNLLVSVSLEDLLQLGLISATTPFHLNHFHLRNITP